ncbi:hypothetical protein RHGRI_034460 [Rhododendron griersonianum]|uniref:Uncharacterized protein n=1 Tax=Rhododendron griersonianum TaxID=479676 RepID=A0AAV6I0R6_9ERIC|nr:hypothetical protein RHGRI_034460 [Rhododendron griersonianum]
MGVREPLVVAGGGGGGRERENRCWWRSMAVREPLVVVGTEEWILCYCESGEETERRKQIYPFFYKEKNMKCPNYPQSQVFCQIFSHLLSIGPNWSKKQT